MATKKPNQSILYNGTATPYMALFDSGGMPIMNVITGIPLGAYISNWSYKYDEEKENLATITFDTGDPDTYPRTPGRLYYLSSVGIHISGWPIYFKSHTKY